MGQLPDSRKAKLAAVCVGNTDFLIASVVAQALSSLFNSSLDLGVKAKCRNCNPLSEVHDISCLFQVQATQSSDYGHLEH